MHTLPGMIAQRLAMAPNLALVVLVFFTYSLFGNIMECIVLSIEKRRFVYNRGFAQHLPFCIIYGFGAMAGYAVLSPLKDNMVMLFIASALAATFFEYIVGNLQLRLFGDFWWDYSKKPFNYKGMLCLESTIGWGLIGIFVIRFAHKAVIGLVTMIPKPAMEPLAVALVLAYAIDFLFSARAAKRQKELGREQSEEIYLRD